MKLLIQFTLITLLFSCAKKPIQGEVLPYEGDEIKIKEAYFQKEVPGNKKDSSQNYLNIEFSFEEGAQIEIHQIDFEGVKYEIDHKRKTYKLKIPPRVDLMNKKMKYLSVYFSLSSKEYSLSHPVKSKEPIFLP